MISDHTSASDFVSATAAKVQSFKSLPLGWHYGQGGPLSVDVANRALQIDSYYRQLGFSTTDAFPGADGEIMLTAYRGSHCIETIISTDLRYSVTHERDDTELSAAPDVDEIAAKQTIRQIGAEIWRSFDLSMDITTTKLKRSSEASRSKTQQVAVYQSFSGTAWTLRGGQFVNTSGSIIPYELLANPLFTGSSLNQYFLSKAA